MNIESLSEIIYTEIISGRKSGERIPAERELAVRLGYSHNRIHRALKILCDRGIILSSGNRKGYFINYQRTAMPHIREKIELTIQLPLEPDSSQAQLWKTLAERFKIYHPEVTWCYDYSAQNAALTDKVSKSDIFLLWPPLFNSSQFLDLSGMADDLKNNCKLIDGILKVGEVGKKLAAVIIAHSPGAYWGHRNMLRRNRFFTEDFTDPLDFFRWGLTLEERRICAMGFSFFGITYHGANWGLDLVRKADHFYMDSKLLESMLIEFKKWVSLPHISYSPYYFYSYFHRGQLALMAEYAKAVPYMENRFKLLGQPLRPGGFACQAALMLAVNKESPNSEVGIDFIRFILEAVNQEFFFRRYAWFSVLKPLYDEQYKFLTELTQAPVAPFDLRGFHSSMDLDFAREIGRYMYKSSAEFLTGERTLESAINKLSVMNIAEIIKQMK